MSAPFDNDSEDILTGADALERFHEERAEREDGGEDRDEPMDREDDGEALAMAGRGTDEDYERETPLGEAYGGE